MFATRSCEIADRDLVEAVRDGDDSAFEELYRRYRDRISAYVRRMVRDPARAEDLAQDAFFSALRRIRATDAEIAFKPWIFEIARNATIDHWRRSSRAEEVSVEADEQLRPSDRGRLVGSPGPDSALAEKQRLEHLRGAFDELSDLHTRVLVMRELEGLSYREIAERLDLSRASVESALFRARRRLASEYADISEGRRCAAMRTVMARLAEGLRDGRDEGRLARHARRCHVCRRRARELGVEPLPALTGLRRKVAALLPLPLFTRRGGAAAQGGAASGGQGASGLPGLLPGGAQVSAALAERTAALVAAVALAGAGSVALGESDDALGGRDGAQRPGVEQRAPEPIRPAAPAAHQAAPAVPDAAAREAARRGDPPSREGERGAGGGAAAPAGGAARVPRLPALPGLDGGATAGAPSAGPQLPAAPGPPRVQAPAPPTVKPPRLPARVEAPAALPLELPAAPGSAAPALDTESAAGAALSATG